MTNTKITYKVEVYPDGSKHWFLNGNLHREDGPAIEYANSAKRWFLNGKCHRDDGPAVELADGTKYWYLNGEFHREDGPAVELADGAKNWYLNGNEYTEKQFTEEMNKRKSDKIVEIDGKKYKLVSI